MPEIPAALIAYLRPVGRRVIVDHLSEGRNLDLPEETTAEDVEALFRLSDATSAVSRLLSRPRSPELLSIAVPRITTARTLLLALERITAFTPNDQVTLMRRAITKDRRSPGALGGKLSDALISALDDLDPAALVALERRAPAHPLPADVVSYMLARRVAATLGEPEARAALDDETRPLLRRFVAGRALVGRAGLTPDDVPADLLGPGILEYLPPSVEPLPAVLVRLILTRPDVTESTTRPWAVAAEDVPGLFAIVAGHDDVLFVAALSRIAHKGGILADALLADPALTDRALRLAPAALAVIVEPDSALAARIIDTALERGPEGSDGYTTLALVLTPLSTSLSLAQALRVLGTLVDPTLASPSATRQTISRALTRFVNREPSPSPQWWEQAATLLGERAVEILSDLTISAAGTVRSATIPWSRYARLSQLLAQSSMSPVMRDVAARLNDGLGDDARAWAHAGALLPTWTGSLDGLIETVDSFDAVPETEPVH